MAGEGRGGRGGRYLGAWSRNQGGVTSWLGGRRREDMEREDSRIMDILNKQLEIQDLHSRE